MSYIFADRIGDRLFVRYLDKTGRKIQKVIDKYPLEVFIPGNRKDSVSLFGDVLSRVEFEEIGEFLNFIKEHKEAVKVYGQTSPAHQWIAKEFPGKLIVSMPNYKVLNFDIEVEHSEGFPDPALAKYEILSISMKVFGEDRKITFGLKPFTPKNPNDIYEYCSSEKELLVKFLRYWKEIDPDVLTGWYIEGFDIPYLINRMNKVLGEDITRQLSPFYKNTKRVFSEHTIGRDEMSYSILGIQVYDYQDLYKKFAPKKLESYKLDFVGEYEEVGRKVDLSKWGNNLMRLYNEDFETFVEYNEQDVALVEKIDDKLKFIQQAISIAYMTHSRWSESLATVKPWDNYFYNLLLEDNIQIPPAPKIEEAEQIVGAYVKIPDPRIFKWIVSLDLTGLYPSIMMLLNMGPETQAIKALAKSLECLKIVDKILNNDPTFLKELADRKAKGICSAANGAGWNQDRKGLLARGAHFAASTRKIIKKEMLDLKKRKEAGEKGHEGDIARLNAAQQAIKVLGNGLYGASANAAFRYFSRDMAEGITTTGQLVIQFISRKINDFLNEKFKTKDVEYVIYNDTDSCYITLDYFVTNVLGIPENKHAEKAATITEVIDRFIKKEIDPLMAKEFAWLADLLGSTNNTLSMKREAIADRGIIRGRKNYVLQVWDMEDVRYHEPEIKSVGVEIVKTSTPKMARDELEEMMKIILNKDNNTLLIAIDEFRKKFYNAKASEIARPTGVSEINGKTLQTKGNPIHVRASLGFNEMVKKHKLNGIYEYIKDGTKMKYVYLKVPNHLRQNVIGFTDDLPQEFDLHKYIDYETQFAKMFLDPLASFTSLIGWEVEKRSTLDELWE